jgi:hypothetical protein
MNRLSLSSARGALMHELGRTGPESTTRVFPAIGMPSQSDTCGVPLDAAVAKFLLSRICSLCTVNLQLLADVERVWHLVSTE